MNLERRGARDTRLRGPNFAVDSGRAIRRDRQPLRTKIVATLGAPHAYKKGFTDLDGRVLTRRELTYQDLVEKFLTNGADILRLNLSHTSLSGEDGYPALRDVYPQVRAAVLAWERKGRSRKRVAVLADLPGPKIRFDFEKAVAVKVGAPFTVHFAAGRTKPLGLVYVSGATLKQAMDEVDRKWKVFDPASLPPSLPAIKGSPVDTVQAVAENVFGLRLSSGGSPDTFGSMMHDIARGLQAADRAGGAGQSVLVRIGDGEVVLRVKRVHANSILCTVDTAKEQLLQGRKGFTPKGVDLAIPSFTREDKEKLEALLECEYAGYGQEGWEPVLAFIGLSFTQTADDVLRLKYHMARKIGELTGTTGDHPDFDAPDVIAKIESHKGWRNRRFILDVADGLMVARGDLGLQMEIENVPAIQKKLIQLCNKRGKPVITATEMLKSMTESMEPTRAEGTDVFNAILDGSDAVMMSEETSKGLFPLHAIRKMISVAVEAETYFELEGLPTAQKRREGHLQRFQSFFLDAEELRDQFAERFRAILSTLATPWVGPLGKFVAEYSDEIKWRRELYASKMTKVELQPTTDRITQAACTLGEQGEVQGILAATTSGRTARMIARLRPRMVVIGAAHDLLNTRKLMASYGVWPICIGEVSELEGIDGIYRKCQEAIAADPTLNNLFTDREIIFTAGTPPGRRGSTNAIQIKKVDPPKKVP